MKNFFLKGFFFSAALLIAGSNLQAQFPKINVPKIGGGKKDKDKNTTGTNSNSDGKAKGGDPAKYKEYMAQARELMNNKKYAEAQAIYEKALSVAPTKSEYSSSFTDEFQKDAQSGIDNAKKSAADCKSYNEKLKGWASTKEHEKVVAVIEGWQDKYKLKTDCACEVTDEHKKMQSASAAVLEKQEKDLETAFNNMKDGRNYKKAVEDFNTAIALAPNSNKAKEAERQVNYAQGELDKRNALLAPVKDDGMTSELHKTNVKKIVFSKSEINSNTSAANLSNSFNLGDEIYLAGFLERSIKNETNIIGSTHTPSYSIVLYVDGAKKDIEMAYNNGGFDAKSSTFFQTLIMGTYTNGDYQDYGLYKICWSLSNGAHKIKLDFVVSTEREQDGDMIVEATTKILASGEFTVNVTDAGKITMCKKMATYPLIKEDIAKVNGRAPKLVPNAQSLVTSTMRENATLIKVVEESTDWTYNKNAFGVILSRHCYGIVLLQDKTTKLYYVNGTKYTQQNTSSGGSSYGATTINWLSSNGGMWCKECLNK